MGSTSSLHASTTVISQKKERSVKRLQQQNLGRVRPAITLTVDQGRKQFKLTNARKAVGLAGVRPRVLKDCAGSCTFSSCCHVYLHCTYTMEILLPVAKNINGQCLNNFRPVALTSQLVKVFEKVVLAQLKQ